VNREISRTGLVYHPDYLEHRTGTHPEAPERLVAIMERLEDRGLLERVVRIEPRVAGEEDILRVHTTGHLERVKNAVHDGLTHLDVDTVISGRSFEVALLAAGGVLEALDRIMEGEIRNALCLVRPPGHHATRDRAMGFCIFNNVAIGARYIQERYGIRRVLIVDWDLHHGNGTQDVFYEDGGVFYLSTHQSPHYPGSGSKQETGAGEGEGSTINLPFPAGTSEDVLLDSFRQALRDTTQIFVPEFIFVSAGFDAHRDDPLGNLNLTESGYAVLTELLLDAARVHCDGRLLSALEGGYNLRALSTSVEEHLRGLISSNA